MKKLLYTFAASLLASGAGAQITINTIPTVTVNRLDSFMLPVSLGAVPSLMPATNGSWDFGAIPVRTTYYSFAYRSPSPGFSVANFADSLVYAIGATSGIDYMVWRNMQQSSMGVQIVGEEIVKRHAYGLGAFTSDPLDSLVISAQPIRYNNPLPVIQVPARMGSKWTATADRIVNFNVTINSFGLNNEPAQHKQVRRYLDSVVGWGQMRVPIPGTGASAWIPVLQVQHSDIVLDSFFLSGAPADPTLLSAIGVSQGQTNTTAYTYYYRDGSFHPLAEALHFGPTHNTSIVSLQMHMRDLPAAVGLPTVPAAGDVRVYPNPVRDGIVQLDLPGRRKEGWRYSLINLQGRQMADGALQHSSAQGMTLTLPEGLAAGVYYISLIHADGQKLMKPVCIE